MNVPHITVSRDAAMALVAHRIRNLTHPGGTLAPWAAAMPDRLSRSREWIRLTAPASVLCALLSRMVEVPWLLALSWLCLVATILLLISDMIDGPWARCISGPTELGDALDDYYDWRAKWALVISALVITALSDYRVLLCVALFRVALEYAHTKIAQDIWALTDEPEFIRVPLDNDKYLFFMDMVCVILILAAGISQGPLWLAVALVCLGTKCIQSAWFTAACFVYRRRLVRAGRLAAALLHPQQPIRAGKE